jgi:hypothetical protein
VIGIFTEPLLVGVAASGLSTAMFDGELDDLMAAAMAARFFAASISAATHLGSSCGSEGIASCVGIVPALIGTIGYSYV